MFMEKLVKLWTVFKSDLFNERFVSKQFAYSQTLCA